VRGRTELFGEYDAAPVEGEEVEVECVDDALAFVYDDYETRGFGARTAVAAGRFRAFEPLRVGCDVVVAGEVDVLATIFTKTVQLVEIVEGERSIWCGGRFAVEFGMRVGDLCSYGGWTVWVLGVEVQQWRWDSVSSWTCPDSSGGVNGGMKAFGVSLVIISATPIVAPLVTRHCTWNTALPPDMHTHDMLHDFTIYLPCSIT
jgi:hypothetical protein